VELKGFLEHWFLASGWPQNLNLMVCFPLLDSVRRIPKIAKYVGFTQGFTNPYTPECNGTQISQTDFGTHNVHFFSPYFIKNFNG
jgi:hypothetical protein